MVSRIARHRRARGGNAAHGRRARAFAARPRSRRRRGRCRHRAQCADHAARCLRARSTRLLAELRGRVDGLPLVVGREPGVGCDENDSSRAGCRTEDAAGARRHDPAGRDACTRLCRRRRVELRAAPRARIVAPRDAIHTTLPLMKQPLRVGIGGPVGSGKTALTLALCRALRDRYQIAVVTNDIYTEEDAAFLVRNEALAADRIIGVETGGCPHTAIREDASINLEAVDRLANRFGNLDVVFVESGGDNLAATFSPELSDLTLYVIDVAAGDKIPRKGGPGITRSDLLIINKIDLAPMVGASLEVMDRDARRMRGERPFVFTNLKTGQGLPDVIAFIERRGML